MFFLQISTTLNGHSFQSTDGSYKIKCIDTIIQKTLAVPPVPLLINSWYQGEIKELRALKVIFKAWFIKKKKKEKTPNRKTKSQGMSPGMPALHQQRKRKF